MPRFKPGYRIFDYTGAPKRNKKGEITKPGIFGYKEGQIQVTALGGRNYDRIRLRDVSSGEEHVISRYDYESLKEELKAGHFKNKAIFFKASYWKTKEGHRAREAVSEQNFERMLDRRYGSNPEFLENRTYLIELYKGLSYDDKAKFFETEDKLIRDLWTYDYALSFRDYPEMKDESEVEFLKERLISYYKYNIRGLKEVMSNVEYIESGAYMERLIRNV